MAVARLSARQPRRRRSPRRGSATRSSSTSARTPRCCARAARRACACSSPRTGDGLEPAPAGGQRRARPRRVHLRDPAPARRRSRGAELVVMGQEAEVLRAHGIAIARRGTRPRRRRGGGAGTTAATGTARRAARQRVRRRRPGADARRLPDRVEQDPRAPARRRLAARAATPTPEECAAALGGAPDDWARLRDAWGERFDERMRLIAERRMTLRVRMLGGTQVGYARMTRRWWTPVHADARRRRPGRRADVLRQLEHPQPGQHRHRASRASARTSWSSSSRRCPRATSCARSWPRFREGRAEGSWENFLYFVARLYFDSHGEEGRAAPPALRAGMRASPTCARRRRCACPRRSSRWPS